MSPTASIVVPTRDRNDLLRQTLRSVLGQRAVDMEVVVVDDGSTEDVASAVRSLFDERVRVVRNESPQGVAQARNRGIEEAQGQWVGFVDDDDLWAPNKLASQLRAMEQTGRRWTYTGAVNIAPSGSVIGGAPPPPPEEVIAALPRRNVIPGGGSNVVAEASLLDDTGGFDPSLFNTEDWDMWIRMARVGVPAWVPEPLLAYRIHSAQASLNIDQILEGIRTIERRYGTRVDQGVVHLYLAESCLRTGHRGIALRYFASAALRGQASNAAADLSAILRRKIASAYPSWSARPRHPDWIAEARTWLEALTSGSA